MIQIVGLGRMGMGVAQRLSRGTKVVGFDRDKVKAEGSVQTVGSLEELARAGTPGKRIFWISIPAGPAVDAVLADRALGLTKGDIVIESGNSNYKDSMRRASRLKEMGVAMLDAGISGGVHGAREGYCLMVGGDKAAFQTCRPFFAAIAAGGEKGVEWVGSSGAGHYVKMVHNAIEYGMLQVLGEGFFLMKKSPFDLDLGKVAGLWMHGSVVRGWLLELARKAIEDKNFDSISDIVGGGETGAWAVEEAVARKVPAPLITAALIERFSSSVSENFGHKLIAALRQQFGGHEVTKK